jgi:AcrR family transcriptional regulator
LSKIAPKPHLNPEYLERVVDAAIACFLRFGLAKTTIEDIARESGLARATVYRQISNQHELYHAVSMRRLSELSERVKPVVDACASFEEALVRGTLVTIDGYRKDKVSMMLLESSGDLDLERFLIDQKSPVVQIMAFLWKDRLALARARGEVRSDLSDIEIAAWLRSVTYILVLSNSLGPKETEAYIRKYLVPSLTLIPPSGKPAASGKRKARHRSTS